MVNVWRPITGRGFKRTGKRAGRSRFAGVGLAVAAAATVVAVVIIGRSIDGETLSQAIREAIGQPQQVAFALAGFATAFVLRTIAWRRLLPTLPFRHGLSAIHLALGANHVLPLRLGEPLRILSVTRRAGIPVETAAASTVTLRAADMLSVVGVGALVAPAAFFRLLGPFGFLAIGVIAVVALVAWRWLAAIAKDREDVRLPDLTTVALAALAWQAESVVVWQAARWAGLELSWSQALLITTVAVAAQIAAFAPGGFGTYEAAAVAAFVAMGFDPGPALIAAVSAHGLKTVYSLVVGVVALVYPSPSFFGRLRLDRGSSQATHRGGSEQQPVGNEPGPVVLFMPAHNEEQSVGRCIQRVPPEVLGRPVHVLVIDDGSTDATAAQARACGADVIPIVQNRGLGNAVRVGLAEAVGRGADAVVFCDADGEYPPEELAALVKPVVDGAADYVIGSRFLGRIDHMQPHRRIGNIGLTIVLSVIARRRITDGQSGYRAFSPTAAADAEIIHDFNYAQVITLDLLAKGYRYHEVPISYHFRTEGESFIRLGSYLRNVVPAIYRELNAGN